MMKKVVSNFTHILIIALGFLGTFINIGSYWEPMIVGIIAAYEIFILILSFRLNRLDNFIILWRLFLGILLFFPMLPLAIIMPEYYCAIFINNLFQFQSLIVFESLALLFWLLVVFNYLNARNFKFKFYLSSYIITIVILLLYWNINNVYIKFGKSVAYLVWIIIFIIEFSSSIHSRKKGGEAKLRI